jgi:hypothetical protein
MQFIPSSCHSLGLRYTCFPVPPFTDDFKLSRRLLPIRILLFDDEKCIVVVSKKRSSKRDYKKLLTKYANGEDVSYTFFPPKVIIGKGHSMATSPARSKQ